MADTDKELRILLKLIADTADQSKITASLNQVQAQAKIVSAELQGMGNATQPLNANLDVSTKQMGALTKAVTSGHASVRTLSSLFGGLGPAAVAASFGVYAIISVLMKQYQEHKQVTDELQNQIDTLDKQKVKWGELVAVAGDYKDVVKIDAQIQQQLEKSADTLDGINAKLRERIDLAQQARDAGAGAETRGGRGFPQTLPSEADDPTLQLAKKAVKDELALREDLHAAALKNLEDWQHIQTEPYQQQLTEVGAHIDDLKAKHEALEKTIAAGMAPGASATQVSEASKAFAQLVRIDNELLVWNQRYKQIGDASDSLDAKTLKLVQDIHSADLKNLDPTARLAAYNEDVGGIQQKLREIGVEAATPAEAIQQSWQGSEEWRKSIMELVELWRTLLGLVTQTKNEQDVAAKKAATDAVNASLRQQQTLLQGIQQQQQLIAANPFLSADAKQQLTLAAMSAELLAIAGALAKMKQEQAGSAIDSETYTRLAPAIQKAQFEFNLLQLKIAAINKPLSAELTEWVNSFGTSAHQIAGIIENSINATLQSTNQLLIDSAFRTGDWRQTIIGLEKQLLQFFLTWIEQQALQLVFGETAKATSTASSVASGAAVAAAHAPAAAATSISSYGTAAVVGEALAVAAIIAIMAALGGGFRKGGYTGDGDESEFAGPAHRKEFVFDAAATRSHGIENLELARRGQAHIVPHFADGGQVSQVDYQRYWQYEMGDHYKADRFALPSNYTEFGGIEPGMLRGTLNGTPPSDHDAWMYQRQPWNPDGSASTGEPIVQVPQFHHDDGRLDPSTLGDDMPLSDWAGGTVPAGVRNGPSITINAGDPNPITANVSGSAGIGPRPRFGAGANAIPYGTDNTGLIGYGGPPGSLQFGGLDPTYNSYNAWLAAIMGGSPAGRPDPGQIYAANPAGGGGHYYNSHTGTWQQWDPTTEQFVDVNSPGTGNVSGSAGYHGQGLTGAYGDALANLPAGSIVVGHDAITGQPVYQAPSGQHYVAPFEAGGRGLGGANMSGGANYYAGTFFNYATGHYNALHDSGSWLAASKNAGAEFYTARDPVRFGMNPTQDGGRNINTRNPWAGHISTAGERAWSAAHSSIFQGGMLPHHATGARIPGPPSTNDTLLAMLATGEGIINAPAMQYADRIFGGQHWLDDLNKMRIPVPRARFAAGGRANGSSSSSSSLASQQPITVIAVNDWESALRKAREMDDHRVFIIDTVNGNRHELGLSPVN